MRARQLISTASLSALALASAAPAFANTATTSASETAATTNEDPDSVTKTAPTAPPVAEKREHTFTHHGITISDPYHWLKDQSYPTIDDEDVLD